MKRLALLSLFAVLACGGDKKEEQSVAMSMPAAKDAGPEDIAITTTDGSMTLAVRGDSLRLRLSDATREKVRAELDTSKVEGDGFAARIKKTVKSKVAAGLGMEMAIPMATIKAARLEGNKLVIESKQTGKALFDGTQTNGKALVDSFSPEDAKKLVDYINSKLPTP